MFLLLLIIHLLNRLNPLNNASAGNRRRGRQMRREQMSWFESTTPARPRTV